jgi:hypothetical protein
MKSKVRRLPLAALFASACVVSPAFADDESPIELTWTAPVSNDDGSPLLDLAGYYVYIGTSPDTLVPSYFMIPNVPRIFLRYPPGAVYYFGVTAVNVNGIESSMTAVLSNIMP